MNKPKFQYWFFIIFTILYFIVLNKFFGITLESVKNLEANEQGDFLAGTFSPLAFLFLILGYLQNNKNLGQNTEAISQQATALQLQAESLKQQASALDTQIAELKISNQSYQKQVEEMQKSVEAQQKMFLLAEKQYLDAIAEKIQSTIPQLSLSGNKYKCKQEYNNNLLHTFDLTLKVQNLSIQNLKINCSFWYITKYGLSYDNASKIEVQSIEANKSVTLIFYAKTNVVPFNKNYIYLDYYDEQNNKYSRRYQITKTNDDFVILEECGLDG